MKEPNGCKSIIMVGTSPNTKGGIATVVRGYAQADLFNRFKCTYVATHRDGSHLQKMATALQGYLHIFFILLKRDSALVHIHLSSRASFWRKSLVCQLARVFRRPYILHVHGSEFMQFYEDECGAFTKKFVRKIFERAALVLALSEQWRNNLLTISKAARVEVLPNAVALPDIGAAKVEGSSVHKVLFVGRLGQRKGVFDLVRAFASIAPRYPSSRLICAGDGAIEEVRNLSDQLGIGDRVECPGWLSAQDTQIRLASADIFVLPSYAEGVPMAMLEAMAWSLPVIVTPVGGVAQVVRHGVNGILVTPGDHAQLTEALSGLLDQPQARLLLGKAARMTIEQSFTLKSTIEDLAGIYRRFGLR